MADFEEAGDDDVFIKSRKDLDAKRRHRSSDAGDLHGAQMDRIAWRRRSPQIQGGRADVTRALMHRSRLFSRGAAARRRNRLQRLVHARLADRRRGRWRAKASPRVALDGSTACGTRRRSAPASPRCVRAARRRSCACRSRISAWRPRALDFGAEGIIAPMINNVADAARFVARGEISADRRALAGARIAP